METLLKKLESSPSLQQFRKLVHDGASLLVEELMPSAKALLSVLAGEETKKTLLFITGAGAEEFKLYNDLPFFTKRPIIELQAWETLPSEKIAPSPDVVGSRFQAFKQLAEMKEPSIVLTTLQGCLQKVLPPSFFQDASLALKTGLKMPLDELVVQLQMLGFEKKSLVADKGEFAQRGGIIDLFPVTSPEPFRIEFFGDEIESLRAFDPASQKSTRMVQEVSISPAKELEFTSDPAATLATLFDYLGKEALIILDDLEALEDRYAALTTLGARSSHNFLSIEQLFDIIQKNQKLFYTKTPIEKLSEVVVENGAREMRFYSQAETPYKIDFEMFSRHFSAHRFRHPFESVAEFLERVSLLDELPEGDALLDAYVPIQKSTPALFVTQTEAEEATLKKKLEAKAIFPSHTDFLSGYLSGGFALRDMELLLFPLTELTRRFKVRRERQRTYYNFAGTDAFDVAPGELVVHFQHGIGKFLGIERRPNHQGLEQEFFLIEYADSAKMYVPLQQAHLITKYVGQENETPKLHIIGGTRWKKQLGDTKKAILGYASELLKLYATRQVHGGFQYAEDSEETRSFEEEFPYIETEDQLTAINDVKKDMCSLKAMDRLVCGDVGYGKTEVALRAAFKAVLDGKKQVAVLVPTTVLAVQHYENFLDRMQSFGVHVALLSRFQKPKEIKEIKEKLVAGSVDVVIGTHRILQEDISFKDLGLIIIDEEQRFGVKAKEHLKKLKMTVDCLTLTATPIPRTLYMSLVGARDLSVITTPPQDRLPIKTIIADPDDTLIQTALLRELSRDGQAYFIHNRVETIYQAAERVKKLLPKARIVVGHGQMSGDELDLVFHAFKRGDADILVATTIVENGIDIPNANTILIDNADHFGIADLYQLRGRVGRWNRRAYAYLLIPRSRSFSEIARKRIEAIAQAGGYGGGMKVAMRDLEMRGAGDILGIEQSGHVADVGFHLYCKLLKRTVDGMQGGKPTIWTLETKVEIPFDARLPEFYINDVQLRMEIYQRLGDASSTDEVDAIFAELKDRFGQAPEQALWLYHFSRLRVIAAQKGFTLVKLDNLTLITERKTGTESYSNKVLLGRIKSPQDLEDKIAKALE